MCTSVKQAGRTITVGQLATFFDYARRPSTGTFGMWSTALGGKYIYNVRDDKVNFWMNQGTRRGLMEIDQFYDHGYFFDVGKHAVTIAVVHNAANAFAIVTTQSQGVVQSVHHRMPAIVDNPDAWMSKGQLYIIREPIELAS